MSTQTPIQMSKFLRDIALRTQGADEQLVKFELEACIREFCEDGLAWPIQVGPLTVKAGQPKLYLDPLPTGSNVGYVEQVLFQADSTYPGGYRRKLTSLAGTPASWQQNGNEPFAYLLEEPGLLVFNPIPTRDYEKALMVDCTVLPGSWSTPLPAFFWTHHRDAIINGTMARLHSMPGKPHTSPRAAELTGRRFRNHVKRTRAITQKRWGRDENTWRYPPFASGQPFGGVFNGYYGRSS